MDGVSEQYPAEYRDVAYVFPAGLPWIGPGLQGRQQEAIRSARMGRCFRLHPHRHRAGREPMALGLDGNSFSHPLRHRHCILAGAECEGRDLALSYRDVYLGDSTDGGLLEGASDSDTLVVVINGGYLPHGDLRGGEA